jgi:hypothetical protein
MSYEIVVVKPNSYDSDARLARIDELLSEGYRVAFTFPLHHMSNDHAIYLHKPPESPSIADASAEWISGVSNLRMSALSE